MADDVEVKRRRAESGESLGANKSGRMKKTGDKNGD